ncbi:MAG TPA: FAD-binding oxidoreductase [Gammaproteobacteria bacterium]|nr:FAD-binding oxidoreductase [Gammaproteobacteria bacterium]
MLLSGWGRYPVLECNLVSPTGASFAHRDIKSVRRQVIPRGLGRSYGDSALAPHVISSAYLNHILDFNPDEGLVRCQSGVSLDDLIDVFLPQGWFLSVTPGTRFVSVGGAIASDVHGKNHHIEGCFSQYIKSVKILLAGGDTVVCSREVNSELFRATCGGMGLTGLILEAELYLKAVKSSFIDETIIKTSNLKHTLELFEQHKNSTYSVAWIDCLAKGENMGRSLLMLGEHSLQGGYAMPTRKKLSVPVDMPSILLNSYTVSAFNTLYYHRIRQPVIKHRIHYQPFFYPLDAIGNWNKLYGKNGFCQYQFVIPVESGVEGMTEVLNRIVESKRGSFLAVLKAFGEKNDNYLSFPVKGYTLALDFKVDNQLFAFLEELDKVVLAYGGRVYLTKDARLDENTFKTSYDNWEAFVDIRKRYNADSVFNSLQSMRLGI